MTPGLPSDVCDRARVASRDRQAPTQTLLSTVRTRLDPSLAAILTAIHPALPSRCTAPFNRLRAQLAMSRKAIFSPASTSAKFAPRTGRFSIDREDGTSVIQTDTPALLTATSRGLIPHLSRDNARLTAAIRHVQLPFESL